MLDGNGSLAQWFEYRQEAIERSYLASDDEYTQSGWAGTPERWQRARQIILMAVPHSGTFLDIGCANGLLLQCLMRWAHHKGIDLVPHGIDFSEKLVQLACKRLPDFERNFVVTNALDWQAQQTFDYVHTLLDYVPWPLHRAYLHRLLTESLIKGGRLIVSSYSSRRTATTALDVAHYLTSLGFPLEAHSCSYDDDGWVLTHSAWIQK